MSGHLDHDILIEAPPPVVWDVVNDLSCWPELYADEYDAIEVLEVDGARSTLQLTRVPDRTGRRSSWVCERIADAATASVTARSVDPGPLLYMHVFAQLVAEGGGTRLRWVHDFEAAPGAPFTTDEVAVYIARGTRIELLGHKALIESRVAAA